MAGRTIVPLETEVRWSSVGGVGEFDAHMTSIYTICRVKSTARGGCDCHTGNHVPPSAHAQVACASALCTY